MAAAVVEAAAAIVLVTEVVVVGAAAVKRIRTKSKRTLGHLVLFDANRQETVSLSYTIILDFLLHLGVHQGSTTCGVQRPWE